jgi:dynein heavy chain
MPEPSAKSLFNIYEIQLGRFFLEHDFNVDIKSCLLSLVSSCLVMYYRVFINFLPTPKKSHYIFNFRDLSKLVKGLMQANSLVVVTKENLVDLFAHECIRVFNDRLITKEDNESFFNHLCETISDYFKISFANPVRPSPKISLSHDITEKFSTNSDQFPLNTLIYGDFIKTDDRIYQPLNNWKQIVSILGEFQMRSNMAGHATRQIVFFKEAVEHIVR